MARHPRSSEARFCRWLSAVISDLEESVCLELLPTTYLIFAMRTGAPLRTHLGFELLGLNIRQALTVS
jgi:hypothetical protein